MRLFFWLLLALVIVASDQFTKWLAIYYLPPYQSVNLLPGFNLTLVFNSGAAFSFLSDAGGWQRWLFVLVAVLISGFILVWLWRLPRENRLLACGLSLILGGAIGNLWDRITVGYVTDFIDLYLAQWHWPAFNIADMAISVGVGLILLETLIKLIKEKNDAARNPGKVKSHD